jgi:hypothetical protein
MIPRFYTTVYNGRTNVKILYISSMSKSKEAGFCFYIHAEVQGEVTMMNYSVKGGLYNELQRLGAR